MSEEKKTNPGFKEKFKESVNRVKAHLSDNKEIYIGCGVSFAAGAIVQTLVSDGNKPSVSIENKPVFNNTNTNTNVVTNYNGYATKIIKCVETGEIFETAKDAATSAGVKASVFSRHINGHTDHVFGKHYEIIGQGTTT